MGWGGVGWGVKTVLQAFASYRHARNNSLGRHPQDAFSELDAAFLLCREKMKLVTCEAGAHLPLAQKLFVLIPP